MTRLDLPSNTDLRLEMRPLMRPMPDAGRVALAKGLKLLERSRSTGRRRRRQLLIRRTKQALAALALTAAASLLTAKGLHEGRNPALRLTYGLARTR
jgi:hypothetical protein